jgi:P27 family predicted phage terminase small subunit
VTYFHYAESQACFTLGLGATSFLQTMPRPRVPSAVKKITGKKGRYGINPNEPQPRNPLISAPDWFNAEQNAVWDYVMRECPPGLLTSLDISTLTMYCVTSAAYKAAVIECHEKGMNIVTEKGNLVQAPWVGQANRAAAALLKVSSELGFTPVSRTKVSTVSTDDKDDNPAAQFFN